MKWIRLARLVVKAGKCRLHWGRVKAARDVRRVARRVARDLPDGVFVLAIDPADGVRLFSGKGGAEVVKDGAGLWCLDMNENQNQAHAPGADECPAQVEASIQAALEAALDFAKANFGFLRKEDLAAIAVAEPVRAVLIRRAAGRYLLPAAAAVDDIAAIADDDPNYLRDVCLPVGDPLFPKSEPVAPVLSPKAARVIERAAEINARRAVAPAPVRQVPRVYFNPDDCGGVFDGVSVHSDADPGL